MTGEYLTLFDIGQKDGADVSDDGMYRTRLWRTWAPSLPRLGIVMLNPSTADASHDDPTIRRCKTFAERDGFGGIMVANLFPHRAPDPKQLATLVDPDHLESSGNLAVLARLLETHDRVLCAWGAAIGSPTGSLAQPSLDVLRTGSAENQLRCLGHTRDGHPRHPLYVKGTQKMITFDRGSIS